MGTSAIPMAPAIQDSFGAQSGSRGGNSSAPANAGSDAMKMAMAVIQQATAQANPQGAIQNRPQLILPQPRVKPQIPMGQPTNQVQATTRAGQRRNDIQSLISSVGNVVKTGVNAKRAKDEQSLMHNLAIIQSAASNPDDPHNQQILETMSKDPKVVKQLQKALGYNPLGGEPPPPEAQTLMKFGTQLKAKQMIPQGGGQPGQPAQPNGQPQGGTPPGQAPQGVTRNNPALAGGGGGQPQPGAPTGQPQSTGQPQGQPPSAMNNLMSRMPNTQQINPIVSMQAELIKAGIMPKNDLGPKALLDFVQEAMKDDTKREEIKARAEATNNQSLMKLYETLTRADTYMKGIKARSASQEKQTHEKAEAYKYGADKRYAAAESKAMTNDKTFRNFKVAVDSYNQDIQRLQEQLSLTLKQKSTGTLEKGVDIDGKISSLKQQLAEKQSVKETLENQMKQRLEIPPEEGGVNQLLQENPTSQDMEQGDFVFGTGNSEPPQ